MKFLKSLKAIFVSLCFSIFNPLFGMQEAPRNELSKLVDTEKLVNLFTKVETSSSIHEGIRSDLGKAVLRNLFNYPLKSIGQLRLRQDVLKKLVELPEKDFNEIRAFIEKMLEKVQDIVNLIKRVQLGDKKLDEFKVNITSFGPDFQNPIFPLISLSILFSGLSAIYASSTGVMDFTSALAISVLLGALWEYFLGFSASAIMPVQYIIGNRLGLFIPARSGAGVVQSFAAGWSWLCGKLVVGGNLLSITHLNRYLQSMGFKNILNKMSHDVEAIKTLLSKEVAEFQTCVDTRGLKLTGVALSEMGFDESEYIGGLEVLLGVASLIRESKCACSSGYERYPITFVDFIESPKFEFTSSNFCNLSAIDTRFKYMIGQENRSRVMSQKFNFKVDSTDHFICGGKNISDVCFLEDMVNPVCLQIILAQTLGIVFGEQSKMTFIDQSQDKVPGWFKSLVFK
jgi:hypothetical protein